MNHMRQPIPARRRHPAIAGLLLASLFLGFAAQAQDEFTLDREWIDSIWQDHIIWRAMELKDSDLGLSEVFCREALQLDPRSADAIKILVDIYAGKGEAALAAMAVGYGKRLEPGSPKWNEAEDPIWMRIREMPETPEGDLITGTTNSFSAGLEKARNLRTAKNDLARSELELRRMLIQYPRHIEILTELGENYRLADERAMHTMLYGYLHTLYPQNDTFLRTYVDDLLVTGFYDAAVRMLETRADIADDGITWLIDAAMTASRAGSEAKALALIERLKSEHPDDPAGWIAHTQHLFSRSLFTDAYPVAIKANAIAPDQVKPVYDLAVLCVVLERMDEAKRWLNRLQSMVEPDTFREMTASGPLAGLAESSEAGDE